MRPSELLRRSFVVACLLITSRFSILGQQTQPQTAPTQPATRSRVKPRSTTATPPAAKTTAKPVEAPALAVDKAVSLALTKPEDIQGDYIPCKFTLGQLRAMVAPDIAPTLSGADAESLKQRVIAAAAGSNSSNDQAGNTGPATGKAQSEKTTKDQAVSKKLNAFIFAVSRDSFKGLTPGEALARIIGDLAVQLPASDLSAEDKVKLVAKQFASPTITPAAAAAISSVSSDPSLKSFGGAELILRQLDLQQRTLLADIAARNSLQDTVTRPQLSAVTQAMGQIQPLADEERIERADLSTASSIVDAARKGVALFERPPDVGCSMSILDWRETSQAFGHLIANRYIAVEVVVRNLNRDQQFALHDVEFEVNADPTGRLGRFFSGRDKVIVRALSSAQSSFDPRNITVHTAQGLGMIMSAAAPVFLPGQALVNAAGVFNSAFVIGLDRYWKDLSTDQLNLLNDVGFSSTKNSQSIVPQSGTVMIVTFIPVKPLEEGWWTQSCVETQYLGSTDSERKLIGLSRGDEAESAGPNPASTASTHGVSVGVDAAQALETCLFNKMPARRKRLWYTLGLHQTTDAGLFAQSPSSPKCDPAYPCKEPDSQNASSAVQLPASEDFFRNAYRVPYKNWSPRAVAIFEQLSNTVVAGTHIVEDQQTLASLVEMKCPKDTIGNLIIDPTAATLDCPLTGKNLNQLAKLRLRNSAAVTDTSTAEGTVTVSGDSANGTVSFAVPALLSLNQPAYDVFGVTLKGVEQKTPVTANLDLKPVITGFDPAVIPTDQTKPINVLGYHLGTLASLTFTLPATTAAAAPAPGSAAAAATPGVNVTAKPSGSGPTDPAVKLIVFNFNPADPKDNTTKLVAGSYKVNGKDSKNNAISYSKTITVK